MRSVTEHQSVVAGLIRPRTPQRLPLAAAAGRVLAEDVIAPRSLPAFDNSAMDGYAVRAADIAGADTDPVVLTVAEDIAAGHTGRPVLEPGSAHRIMTGAPMPEGADTVVQVEATDGGVDCVRIHESRRSGTHVRRAGEDVRAGERVLTAATTLGPAQLGLLAALGEPEVLVFPPLRVLVLSTGSELVEPGQPLEHGQIHESNGVMLAAAVRAAGAEAEQLHFVADDVAEFHQAIAGRLDGIDLLLTSGGVSAGAYEVVKDALTGQGIEFVKVAMQPGMPQGCGEFEGVAVVTLPGNPVSSLVSFEVFVRPALRAAMGFTQTGRRVVAARLAEDIDSPRGRRQFRRGFLDEQNSQVRPIGPPGSHFLRWLAASDCLLDIAEDVESVAAGTTLPVWVLD